MTRTVSPVQTKYENSLPKMKTDNFVKLNKWLDTCPFGDYITNKLDYDPKTKYWEFKFKVPNISKQIRDSYTDPLAEFYKK